MDSFAFYRVTGPFVQFEALLGEIQIELLFYKHYVRGRIVNRVYQPANQERRRVAHGS